LATGGGLADQVGEVRLWDVSTYTLRTILSGHHKAVYASAFEPSGRCLLTASYDGVVKLWDVVTAQELSSFSIDPQFVGLRLALSGDYERALVACAPGAVFPSGGRYRAGDVLLWRRVAATDRAPAERSARTALALGGRRLALCRIDLEAKEVVESRTGNRIALVQGLQNRPDVEVWNLSIGHEIITLRHQEAHVYALAFSPDGGLLASGGSDEIVRLWDTATGYERATLRGHTAQVNSVAFAPNGKLLVSGSHDRTVRVWDVATGSEQALLCGHAGAVTCVAFSPDGQLIASGSYDKTVRLWPLN
jgi:WD40 repeat protein